MSRQLPFLAMDGVLCDYPLPMVGGKATIKKETKMKTMSTSDAATYGRLFVKNRAVANRFLAKCMGQDAAMDDETVAMIKEFLSDKLSDKDHTKVCAMLNGDVEAQHNEPPPGGMEPPAKLRGAAEDARLRDDFSRRNPGLSKIGIDNYGIQPGPRGRVRSHSAADTEDFYRRYPDARRIKQA